VRERFPGASHNHNWLRSELPGGRPRCSPQTQVGSWVHGTGVISCCGACCMPSTHSSGLEPPPWSGKHCIPAGHSSACPSNDQEQQPNKPQSLLTCSRDKLSKPSNRQHFHLNLQHSALKSMHWLDWFCLSSHHYRECQKHGSLKQRTYAAISN
jgi:hypothetical protein